MDINYLSLKWRGGELYLLDQRKLPFEEDYFVAKTLEDGHYAIEEMIVRGAPLIGFTALFSLALWSQSNKYSKDSFSKACEYIKSARPTAVNLQFEVDRLRALVVDLNDKSEKSIAKFILSDATTQMRELAQNNLNMAKATRDYLISIYGNKKLNILTICNTGALACGPMGTALGTISYLNEKNSLAHVWSCETRPYLQGSRLTSFELMKEGINHHIVVEGAVARLMESHNIDAVLVGADRIVQNGDTANKIGTQMLSILAKRFSIPFIVLAPISSFDLSLASGKEIKIELRNEKEVCEVAGLRVAPKGAKAWNPSFDVTKGEDISAIACEEGMIFPVTVENIKNKVGGSSDSCIN